MSRLTIKDKDAKLIRLDLDGDFAWAQKEFVAEVERQHNAGHPIRIIVLKGRQVGISTAVQGLLFNWSFMFPGSNSLVMSKNRPDSENLFEMAKLMWSTWPFRPFFTTTRSSTKRLSWAETLSNFKVESAKGNEVGRGSTIQACHGSEVAFWENAEDLMPSLMNAIPNRHGTIVVLESTANGVGGFFYDEWMKAVRGESEYTALFFPWFRHDEYSIRNTTLISPQLLPSEITLQETFGLSLGQLAWRRRKIREMNNDEEWFKQEYPCTYTEAFLSTGANVFDTELLHKCYSPPGSVFRGEKIGMTRGDLINDNGTLRLVKMAGGPLAVYKLPDPRKRYKYVVGADPSRTIYGDPCCIQVLNRTTLEQCAVWRGHATQDALAEMIANLGHWYNSATVNCEIEGGGAGVIAVLQHLQYPWIWRWRQPDRPLHRRGNVFGWSTNTKTKAWGIGELIHYVSLGRLILHDQDTFLEMQEYVNLDGIEMGPASNSGNDDTVMALMVALMTNLTEEPPDLGEMHGMDQSPVPVGAAWQDDGDSNREIN